MGIMFLKKLSLLLLLISGSFLPTYSQGGRSKFMSILAEDIKATKEGTSSRKSMKKEEESIIQERLLKDNTRDYGRYDPSPSLSKPPFKLIPN
ncbi:PREDICTED: uncharacterized protein LOC109353090 [Lupinus angustifolius]|uniref:uncharacterized protein LOC109353090 n=1 Tax=Lupinus angustifolius TaxID=3871 RepID=UPI00092E9B30|nr:PREDICTED: uncharacterized protein LOC109353090 [Lupinus angustifolius]